MSDNMPNAAATSSVLHIDGASLIQDQRQTQNFLDLRFRSQRNHFNTYYSFLFMRYQR